MTKRADPAAFLHSEPVDPASENLPDPAAFDPVVDWRRKPGWTVERQRCFIATLAETGSVRYAAETAGVTARSAYRLRLRPGAEGFRRAWAQAQRIGVEALTSIAFDRAIHGTPRGVYAAGKRIGEEWVPSDRLLIYLLQHLDSMTYGNLSGLQTVNVPNPVAGAHADLPASAAALIDQPIQSDADMFERFDACQHFPERE